MIKLRRFLYIGGAFLLLLVKFTIDVISKNVELEIGGLSLFRELLAIGAYALIYLTISSTVTRQGNTPLRRLGLFLIVAYGVLFVTIGFSLSAADGFDRKNLSLLPMDYPTLFFASVSSLILTTFAVLSLRLLSDLVPFQDRKGNRRNYLVLVGLILASALSVAMLRPLDSSILTTVLIVLSIIVIVVNSYRFPWIVYLTKREKIYTVIFAFFLFLAFVGLTIFLAADGTIKQSLLYYSYPARQFVFLVSLFGCIYFGMAFVSTLFHLPTADAFDRKRSEVTSLHNLSRLITQVFDFNELVDTVTSMTLQVCEAKSCWLELLPPDPGSHASGSIVADSSALHVVAMKNVALADIDLLHRVPGQNLRDDILRLGTTIVIDDVLRDSRFGHLKKAKNSIAAIVATPLVSHNVVIGILYATKEFRNGFVKDDMDAISAFADQATIAIENSRLINQSIERERLLREMALAQEMQRRLLPQVLPSAPMLEVDAVSTPAFEVGGDYYDFVQLDDRRLGIVVGDVSGKGVSAAFYMSEVKGIFQALSRLYPSPRDFLIRANDVLMGTVDRHSFISLVFAVMDIRTGQVILSRAGHCPMLLVSADEVHYVRPGGMGLGLSRDAVFAESLEEQCLQLNTGDVCVFYTDGITEARCRSEEFGYDRLLEAVRRVRHLSASGIKDHILKTVHDFVEQQAHDDDITLVVVKWKGTPA